MRGLTEADIFKVACFDTKIESVNYLRRKIKYDLEIKDEFKYQTLLDLTLDLIEFCLVKGLSLHECLESVDLQCRLFQHIASSGSNADIKSCLSYFISQVSNRPISETNLKRLIDYVNSTVFTHFNLYKYVLINEREQNIKKEERDLLRPRKAEPGEELTGPKPYSIWEYEQKIAGLELREKNVKQRYSNEYSNLNKTEEETIKDLKKMIRKGNKSPEAKIQLDEQIIIKLAEEISGPIIDTNIRRIKAEFNELKELNMIQKQRQQIVRPSEDEKLLAPVNTKGNASKGKK